MYRNIGIAFVHWMRIARNIQDLCEHFHFLSLFFILWLFSIVLVICITLVMFVCMCICVEQNEINRFCTFYHSSTRIADEKWNFVHAPYNFFFGQIRKQILLKHIKRGFNSTVNSILSVDSRKYIVMFIANCFKTATFWKCHIYTHLIYSTIDLWLRKHFRFNLISDHWQLMEKNIVCICAESRPREDNEKCDTPIYVKESNEMNKNHYFSHISSFLE